MLTISNAMEHFFCCLFCCWVGPCFVCMVHKDGHVYTLLYELVCSMYTEAFKMIPNFNTNTNQYRA